MNFHDSVLPPVKAACWICQQAWPHSLYLQRMALLKCGLLSKGQFTWVSKYLMTLDDIWANSSRESIDFLLFTIEDTNISPMLSYVVCRSTSHTEMLDFVPLEIWNTPRDCRNQFYHAFHEEHFASMAHSGSRNLRRHAPCPRTSKGASRGLQGGFKGA